MAVRDRSELEVLADTIRDETTPNANTALRVGGFCRDLVDSLILGSEAGSPLSYILYVDEDSPGEEDLQDGSIDHPFQLIQEAINAAFTGTTILIVNSTSGENVTVNNKNIVLAAYRVFTRRPFVGYARAGANVEIGNVTVTGSPIVTLAGLNVGNISSSGTLNINSACDIAGEITGGAEIRASDSDFNSDITAGFGADFIGCRFGDGIDISVSGTSVQMESCKFGSTIAVSFTGDPGTLTLDAVTNDSWESSTATLNDGNLVVLGTSVKVETFTTASGSWAKDPQAKKIGFFLKGSGGGGGQNGTTVGGGGGGAGEETYNEFVPSLVPPTLNWSIGLPGTGSAAGGGAIVSDSSAFTISANGGLPGGDGDSGAAGGEPDETGMVPGSVRRGCGGAGGATLGSPGVRGRGGGSGGTGGSNAPGGGGKGYGAGGGGGASASNGGGGGGGGYGDGVTGGTIEAENGTPTAGGSGRRGIIIVTTWR